MMKNCGGYCWLPLCLLFDCWLELQNCYWLNQDLNGDYWRNLRRLDLLILRKVGNAHCWVVEFVVVAVVDAVAAFVQRPQQLFLWIFGNLLGREWPTRTPRSASGVLAIFWLSSWPWRLIVYHWPFFLAHWCVYPIGWPKIVNWKSWVILLY